MLLVDPDGASRRALQATFSALGCVRLERAVDSFDVLASAVLEPGIELAAVVLDTDIEGALEAIRRARAAAPGVPVLTASRARDGETILRSLRAGAGEFLTLPVDPEEARGAIERLTPEVPDATGGRGTMIAVTGTTGGAGCTTLAVNLAYNLAKVPGASVALLDIDLLLGSVDIALDVMPELTMADVASEIDRYDETLLRRVLARHDSGIHVLTAPTAMEDAAKVQPGPLRELLERLRRAFSFVVIDTSKGFQETDFVALDLADSILLTTQLDVCGLRNGARLMKVFRQIDGLAERVQVVLNRVEPGGAGIGPEKAAETLGAPIAWQIPNMTEVVTAARAKGVPVAEEAPNSKLAHAIEQIARSFSKVGPEPRRRRRRLLGGLTSMFS